MSAGQPALPELRAMPAPTPGPGLLSAPDAAAEVALPVLRRADVLLGAAQQPAGNAGPDRAGAAADGRGLRAVISSPPSVLLPPFLTFPEPA